MGDLAESGESAGQALLDVLGLIIRRHSTSSGRAGGHGSRRLGWRFPGTLSAAGTSRFRSATPINECCDP